MLRKILVLSLVILFLAGTVMVMADSGSSRKIGGFQRAYDMWGHTVVTENTPPSLGFCKYCGEACCDSCHTMCGSKCCGNCQKKEQAHSFIAPAK